MINHFIFGLFQERKRVAAAEQQAKALEMAHEARVAGLETRLAELSETVGGYDRLRQYDQHAIQNLKDQLASLEDAGRKEFTTAADSVQDPLRLTEAIRDLYARLLDTDNKKSDSSNVQGEKSSLISHATKIFIKINISIFIFRQKF